MSASIDGGWLAVPAQGRRAGEGGDCFEVAYFADDELSAYRYCNSRDGFKAVYVLPGQTVLEAWEKMRDQLG
ncbi:hypothetical protein [Nocardia wallacei]|uniref:hypothetical protein n=1 Tax=Nocardia wallacei TaxID=480035 RepID=UPI002454B2AB|nr:hypothetical protein [Nocardia wallacei]